MKTLAHTQTKGATGSFSLRVSQVSPYFGIRTGAINRTKMSKNGFIVGHQADDPGYLDVLIDVFDGGVFLGTFPQEFLTSGITTPAQLDAQLTAAAATFASSYGLDTIGKYFPVVSDFPPRSFSNPSLAVNTSRQPSTTRDTMVNASVDITSTISLTTGQNGKVSLQYADNTGFTTNVVTVQSATNGNTGSLTIGLNLSQVYTAALTGIVPAGKYYRLVTTNVTGTPTYGTPVIQEVLL